MSAVATSVAAGVATISMDQPHNRNALTPTLVSGLDKAFAGALADAGVRVIVLTNTGPAFCAGADLSASDSMEQARPDITGVMATIQDSPKPVVARIAGHCMGGGVGLAAACDLSVAADDVRFGFTEVRIGVAPAIISVVCLPKLSRADALELYLTGERITAARAAEVGLINRAVTREELDSSVEELVGKLAAGAPGALAEAKRMVYDVPGQPRDEAFAAMTRLSQDLFSRPEAVEGMAAFREKRRPPWVP